MPPGGVEYAGCQGIGETYLDRIISQLNSFNGVLVEINAFKNYTWGEGGHSLTVATRFPITLL